MSESDSFIDEVSEELRRDRLFKLFKKYGWVMGLLVVAIVGGTAYNEWRKSSTEREARLNGDLMIAAETAGNAAALDGIAARAAPLAILAGFEQANLRLDAGDTGGALTALRTVANDLQAAPLYSDLAWLKILMLDGANMPESERNSAYDRLMAPGAPYRLLAQEQRAMQYVRDGDVETAKATLASILADPGITPGLRNRAQQLTVALGGDAGAGASGE